MPFNDASQLEPVVRLSLGLIFLASGLVKLRHPRSFAEAVLDYRVLPSPLGRAYGWSLPPAELGTGLLLLSGWQSGAAAVLAVLMLMSFSVALAINAARGRDLACHCFGSATGGRVGWHSLPRSLGLLVPAAWLGVLGWTAGVSPVALEAVPPGPIVGTAILAALAYALLAEALELLVGPVGRGRDPSGRAA